MRSHLLLAAGVALALVAGEARADVPCGAVEIRFKPGAPHLQIGVWVEDASGKVVDTPWITQLTGFRGLANRPGAALLKTDCGWPYGRREMVLPIWAHRRDHHYPKVMMGGVCGNSPQGTCPTGGLCGGDCEDSTIAYHSRVSSYEPFYCGPGMGSTCVDVVTCASKGTFSKGAFAENPPVHTWSYYPPRADITAVNPAVDSPDLALFAQLNDLVAVSQATPPAAKPTDGPVVVPWYPQALNPPLPPGDYVAWIELSQESDWGPGHDLANPDHLNQADSVSTWDFEGHQFLGQPSVVYRVPFHYDALGSTSASSSYVGYSTWDGSDGVIHAPDPNTIYDRPGSGAGRLLDAADGATSYRLEVVVGSCGGPPDMATGPHDGGIGTDGGHLTDGGATPDLAMGIPPCRAPDAATHLAIVPQALGVTVSFDEPTGGVAPMRYAVRYREGTTAILSDADFDGAAPADFVAAGTPGGARTMSIPGMTGTSLKPDTDYTIAVRAESDCGRHSAIISASTHTLVRQFATLHGCFIATAAYGSPLAGSVRALRAFRDARLLPNAAGSLAVAAYYAFSPPLAAAIAPRPSVRALVRRALEPLVTLVERASH